MKGHRAVFVLALCLAQCMFAQYNSYTVPRATGKIAVDGRLDESDWKSAALVTSFRAWKSGGDVPATRAWIVQEKEHLVLAMECMEEFPDAMHCTALHDGTVWQDDHIELFLDSAGERKSCVQILVNAKGVVADAYYADAFVSSSGDWSWECEAEVKTAILQDRWCLEMRLPFAVLPPFTPGNDWTFHLVRSRYTFSTQHMTSLQGALDSFHDIQKYDNLCGIAGDSCGVQTTEQSFGTVCEGETRSWMTLRNRKTGDCDARIVVEVVSGKEILESHEYPVHLGAQEERRIDVVWPCRMDMLGKCVVMRLEVGGKRVQSFTRMLTHILPMIGDLDTNISEFATDFPGEFSYSLNLAAYEKSQDTYWELWTEDGRNCLVQGRSAVRGQKQRIRVYTTNLESGIYHLRRFLVDGMSGSVIKGRSDVVSLVKAPWQK